MDRARASRTAIVDRCSVETCPVEAGEAMSSTTKRERAAERAWGSEHGIGDERIDLPWRHNRICRVEGRPQLTMNGRTHDPAPQAITQKRLPSGSARTTKSASSGYSQSTLCAPREIKRSTWAC